MNYDDMTDGELSFAAATHLHGDAHFWSEDDVVLNGKKFDITNPLDMWPLIEEAGISLTKDTESNLWYADIIEDIAFIDNDNWSSYSSVRSNNKSPLRAAAICWLMIKEAK